MTTDRRADCRSKGSCSGIGCRAAGNVQFLDTVMHGNLSGPEPDRNCRVSQFRCKRKTASMSDAMHDQRARVSAVTDPRRIALVTARQAITLDEDLSPLANALHHVGVEVHIV